MRRGTGKGMQMVVPKPTLPSGGMPTTQKTGIDWKVTESADWQEFGASLSQKPRKKPRPSKPTINRRPSADDDEGPTRRMPLSEYAKGGVALPMSFDALPTDADIIEEVPTPQTLMDAASAARRTDAALLDQALRSLSTLDAPPPPKPRPQTPSRYLKRVHLTEVNPAPEHPSSAANMPLSWLAIDFQTQTPFTVTDFSELFGVRESMVVLAEVLPLVEGVKGVPVVYTRRVSVQGARTGLKELGLRGVRVLKEARCPQPHDASQSTFSVQALAAGMARSERDVDDYLLSLRDSGVPNYYTGSQTRYAFDSLVLQPGFSDDPAAAILALIARCKLQRGLRTNPLNWKPADLSGIPDPLAKALYAALYATNFCKATTLSVLQEYGYIQLLARHATARLWNTCVSNRLAKGFEVAPGDVVRSPKLKGITVATGSLIAEDPHLALCFPTLGYFDEKSNAPPAYPVYELDAIRDVLKREGIALEYPITQPHPEVPLQRMQYRRVLADLSDLDWQYGAKALVLVEPDRVLGRPAESRLRCETCLAPASAKNLAVSFSTTPDVRLGIIFKGLGFI